jgi:hypothetical protein
MRDRAKKRRGNAPSGSRHTQFGKLAPNHATTPEADAQMRALRADGANCVMIAERLGVSNSIVQKRTVGIHPKGARTVARMPSGERHHASRLTEELVRFARSEHARGVSLTVIAQDLGLHRSTVAAAVEGKTWCHVV